MKINEGKIKEILERGVSGIIEKSHLERALRSGKKLRVKFGIDPTSPDLHLGHAVPFRKLKQFQEVGHEIIFIIGDFTARIGDPSGRESARKPLTPKEVKSNLKKYLSLAGKIINIKNAKMLCNSKWLANTDTLLRLASIGSIQYVMKRDEFRTRQVGGQEITILEAMYPLFQGYDSVKIGADVEVGGADQELNLLAGRKLQKYFGQKEQDILMTPLLTGTDGVRKMSKSFSNYIALNDAPQDMFGKIMSLPDNLLEQYFLLSTDVPMEEAKKLLGRKPFEAKKVLAYEIVKLYHRENFANKAREYFEKTFSKKEIPENLRIYRAKVNEEWADFLTREKLISSHSEAKRLIEGGGLDFNGKKIARAGEQISESGTVKIGKYKFIKIDVRA
ncbi:MAG: tyrosyl-tRNA synthetase, tyrosyl-tRNA synthetase [Parcubacteria group bacterium GW2011_GWC1_45_13]|uniref:Tyrosine--tRNA ligase n=2 Tax=Candidatus Giovannoniibacteriota TaxID=1752738 RepID=A0A0G1IVJ4_9BACT|nr:MAG: Tyrosine-tRNA ligase [Candidatus Giovannonibacteria bacterium GW2011_GWB1_44_23]KKT63431.1 MAG: Tyrosine-tRNA ligase [Candidatus Giovannonibacteria bacterium GW2011_GWA1_44_29]KKT91459.1 MAG: tyrosyl-tRNA synthetase, tyrosyl-tRNA synthetase [Parcubacteria group bacterium GW2011_GWC1_45_13]